MFNGVDGKGFASAAKGIVKMIQELKPLLWFLAVTLLVSVVAPNGFF